MESIYISQLNEQERKAYEIAKAHLGTSFNILKSNGYLEWVKKYGGKLSQGIP
jgi:hypothetical protein